MIYVAQKATEPEISGETFFLVVASPIKAVQRTLLGVVHLWLQGVGSHKAALLSSYFHSWPEGDKRFSCPLFSLRVSTTVLDHLCDTKSPYMATHLLQLTLHGVRSVIQLHLFLVTHVVILNFRLSNQS